MAPTIDKIPSRREPSAECGVELVCYLAGVVISTIESLASHLMLGDLLEELTRRFGGYDLIAHWTQGEFHHDVVVRIPSSAKLVLPGSVLIVATNCNGGVKEVLCFADEPSRAALWHHRCPLIPDFAGDLPPILARAVTLHWFDPCELLGPDARSELKPEHRRRQNGGGWEYADHEPGACSTASKK